MRFGCEGLGGGWEGGGGWRGEGGGGIMGVGLVGKGRWWAAGEDVLGGVFDVAEVDCLEARCEG